MRASSAATSWHCPDSTASREQPKAHSCSCSSASCSYTCTPPMTDVDTASNAACDSRHPLAPAAIQHLRRRRPPPGLYAQKYLTAQPVLVSALDDFALALGTASVDQVHKLATLVSRYAPQVSPSLEVVLGILLPGLQQPDWPRRNDPHAPLTASAGPSQSASACAPFDRANSVVFAEQAHPSRSNATLSSVSESAASDGPEAMLLDADSTSGGSEAKSISKRREDQVRRELHSKEWVALMDPASRDAWASERFNFLQQNPCKEWAVNLIKAIDPAKQTNIPYKNKKKPSRRPPYWPPDPAVRHDVTPSHLKKEERVKLLVHFLFLPDNNAAYYDVWRRAQPCASGRPRMWADMLRDVVGITTFGTDGPRRPKARSQISNDVCEDRYANTMPAEARKIEARLEIMDHVIFTASIVERQSGSGWSMLKTKLPSLPPMFQERLVGQQLRIRKDRPPRSRVSKKRKRDDPKGDDDPDGDNIDGFDDDDDDVEDVEDDNDDDDNDDDYDDSRDDRNGNDDRNDDNDDQFKGSDYAPTLVTIPSRTDMDTSFYKYEAHPGPIGETLGDLDPAAVAPSTSELDPGVYTSLPTYNPFHTRLGQAAPPALRPDAQELLNHTQQASAMQHLSVSSRGGELPRYQSQATLPSQSIAYQMANAGYGSNVPLYAESVRRPGDLSSGYDPTSMPPVPQQMFGESQYTTFAQPMYMMNSFGHEPDASYGSFGRPEY